MFRCWWRPRGTEYVLRISVFPFPDVEKRKGARLNPFFPALATWRRSRFGDFPDRKSGFQDTTGTCHHQPSN